MTSTLSKVILHPPYGNLSSMVKFDMSFEKLDKSSQKLDKAKKNLTKPMTFFEMMSIGSNVSPLALDSRLQLLRSCPHAFK